MTFQTWWLFLSAVFLLSGTPGPNMLHILARSVRVGLRRSVAAMAGCLSAVILVLVASAAGLSAVLLASPVLFDGLRYAGVAYLVILGIRAWRGHDGALEMPGAAGAPASVNLRRLYRDGLLIGLSNPKLLLFGAAGQLGIFMTLMLALALGFDIPSAVSVAATGRSTLRAGLAELMESIVMMLPLCKIPG